MIAGMRLVAVPALVLVVACYQSVTLPDASNGSASPCPTQGAFFCADFDEAMSAYYGDGVELPVPMPTPAGATAVAQPPAVSQPNGLWVDTSTATTGHYDVMYSNVNLVTKLHAELDLRIDRPTPNSSELVELGTDNATGTSCHFQLQIHSDQSLRVRWHDCSGSGTQNPEMTFFTMRPLDFHHYTLDFDIVAGTASVTLDRGTATSDPLPFMGEPGTPFVDVGVFAIGGSGGPTVAFDNVVVTTSP
jgi:hypothetical protein